MLRQIHTEHPEAMYPAASCALGDLCEVTLRIFWTLALCWFLPHELKRTSGSHSYSDILDAIVDIAVAFETLPAVLMSSLWMNGSLFQVRLAVQDGTSSISIDLGRHGSAQFLWTCFPHPPDMLTVLILSLPPASELCLAGASTQLGLTTYTDRQKGVANAPCCCSCDTT